VPTVPDSLPTNAKALRALLLVERTRHAEELAAARNEAERLTAIIKELQRHRFGRRSELLDPDQLALALEDLEQTIAAAQAAAEKDGAPPAKPAAVRKRQINRGALPAHLPREEIVIDAGAMLLKVRGELTTTTATEFRLLDYLARHPGRVFSRDHLLDAVWGDARFVTPRSVDVYVRRIREKIEIDPENPRYLKTVRGAGYRFELPKGE